MTLPWPPGLATSLLIGRSRYYGTRRNCWPGSDSSLQARMEDSRSWTEISRQNCVLSGWAVLSSVTPSNDAKKKKKSIKFHKLFVLKYIFSVQILSYFIEWKVLN